MVVVAGSLPEAEAEAEVEADDPLEQPVSASAPTNAAPATNERAVLNFMSLFLFYVNLFLLLVVVWFAACSRTDFAHITHA